MKKKYSFKVKIDPFKVEKGKCPVKQKSGAGPHKDRKKSKHKRAKRNLVEREDT